MIGREETDSFVFYSLMVGHKLEMHTTSLFVWLADLFVWLADLVEKYYSLICCEQKTLLND
jgi:hypothetical protein